MEKRRVIFVHGWSVTTTDTYGQLPERLEAEARSSLNLQLDVEHVFLSKYVSFQDEVTVDDLSRGFQAALERQVKLQAGERFVCITHSTGGPVIRDWWQSHYPAEGSSCPMSHLIMLAPANFGSALAQLGKSRLSDIRSMFEGVEPGKGVLDWLELGSPESMALNLEWIQRKDDVTAAEPPVFPFALTGQSIDRGLFDHLNTYTGEIGSDGVVRAAAANLNASYVRLVQKPVRAADVRAKDPEKWKPNSFEEPTSIRAQSTAFRIIEGRSHSGDDIGIMRSVPKQDPPRNNPPKNPRPHPTVTAILRCLQVNDPAAYRKLVSDFNKENTDVIETEQVEHEHRLLLSDRLFFHDPCSMVIFRVQDERNNPVNDFKLLLTGDGNDPDHLPEGFLIDRQQNQRHKGTLIFFLNHAKMIGSPTLYYENRKGQRKRARKKLGGLNELGFILTAKPKDGYAHYYPCQLKSSPANLQGLIGPTQTTIVDIVLRRVVRAGVYNLTTTRKPRSFKDQPKEGPID